MNALRAVLLLGVLLVSAPAFADEIFEKIGTVGGLSYGIAPHERVAAGITYKRIEEKLADVSFTGAGWDLGGCYRHPPRHRGCVAAARCGGWRRGGRRQHACTQDRWRRFG